MRKRWLAITMALLIGAGSFSVSGVPVSAGENRPASESSFAADEETAAAAEIAADEAADITEEDDDEVSTSADNAATAGASVTNFSDVKSTAYYYDYVNWAVKKGITSGTGNGKFSPNDPCTRSQIVTFLYKAENGTPVSGAKQFSDVKSTAFYYDAVGWAVSREITNGTGPNTFSPKRTCTRAEAVTFLWKASGGEKVSKKTNFTDVPEKAYYYEAVNWAVEKGITAGTGKNKFSPKDPCSRAQIVTFIYKYKKSSSEASVDLRDNVIDMEYAGNVDVTVSGNSVTAKMPNSAIDETVTKGDILMLPGNEENPLGTVVKVEDQSSSAGYTTYSGTVPDIAEVMSSVDISVADVEPVVYDSSIGWSNGQVKIVEEETGSSSSLLKASYGDSYPLKAIEYQFVNESNLSGSFKIQPTVDVDLKADFALGAVPDIKSVTVRVHLDPDFNVKLSGSVEKRIPLKSLPISLGWGFGVIIQPFIVVSASGEVTFDYTITTTTTVSYKKGDKKISHNFTVSDKLATLDIKANAAAGIDCTNKLVWVSDKVNLVEFDANVQEHLDAAFQARSSGKPTYCADVKLYPVAYLQINSDCIMMTIVRTFNSGAELKWTLLDNNDSNRYRYTLHIEDGKTVSECTYGKNQPFELSSVFGKTMGEARNLIPNARWDSELSLEEYNSGKYFTMGTKDESAIFNNATAYAEDPELDGAYSLYGTTPGMTKDEFVSTVKNAGFVDYAPYSPMGGDGVTYYDGKNRWVGANFFDGKVNIISGGVGTGTAYAATELSGYIGNNINTVGVAGYTVSSSDTYSNNQASFYTVPEGGLYVGGDSMEDALHLTEKGLIIEISTGGNDNSYIYGVKPFMSVTAAEQAFTNAGLTKVSSGANGTVYKDASGNAVSIATDHGIVYSLQLTWSTYYDALNG